MESPRRGWLLGYAGYGEAEIRAAARVVGALARQEPANTLLRGVSGSAAGVA